MDDVLPSLQLMLGASHSLSADYTFFNAMASELLHYAPPAERSRLYREMIELDARNHILRWRWEQGWWGSEAGQCRSGWLRLVGRSGSESHWGSSRAERASGSLQCWGTMVPGVWSGKCRWGQS